MNFSIDAKLFDVFPSLKIGVLICEIDNTKYGEDQLEAILEHTKASFVYDKPQDHPHIKVWREAFTKLGDCRLAQLDNREYYLCLLFASIRLGRRHGLEQQWNDGRPHRFECVLGP